MNSTSCHSCAESLRQGKVLAAPHTPNKTPASYQNCQWKQQNLPAKAEKLLLTLAVSESWFGDQSFSSDTEGNPAFFLQSLFYQLTEHSPTVVPSLEYSCAEKREKGTLIHLIFYFFLIHRSVQRVTHTTEVWVCSNTETSGYTRPTTFFKSGPLLLFFFLI